MRIINLPQGSPAWHDWRADGIGASEAAAVIGESPYDTPEQLWLRKTGQIPEKDNPWGFNHGHRIEPIALAAWEDFTGESAMPVCIQSDQHSFLRASLDGLTICRKILVEIKAPNEDDHALAVAGRVPRKYWIQMQHQSMTAPEVEELHYWSYREDTGGVLVVVEADRVFQQNLLLSEQKFWECVMTGVTPVSDAMEGPAKRWREAYFTLKEAESWEESAREELLKHVPADSKYFEGHGVSATRVDRRGSIDYKRFLTDLNNRLPDHLKVSDTDLDAYRKGDSHSWRVDAIERSVIDGIARRVNPVESALKAA